MKNVEEFADQLVKLSVEELTALAKVLKDKYGLEPAAAAPVVVEVKETEKVVEKTEFDVILKTIGEGTDKLNTVKEINILTNIGLKEAMNLTKSLPAKIKERASKTEAESIKTTLAALNAEVELV